MTRDDVTDDLRSAFRNEIKRRDSFIMHPGGRPGGRRDAQPASTRTYATTKHRIGDGLRKSSGGAPPTAPVRRELLQVASPAVYESCYGVNSATDAAAWAIKISSNRRRCSSPHWPLVRSRSVAVNDFQSL